MYIYIAKCFFCCCLFCLRSSPSLVDDFVIVVVIPVGRCGCRGGSERPPAVVVVPLSGAAAQIGETEDPELVPEERAHGHVDEQLEKRVADAEPEDGEVQERYGVDAVLCEELVERQADERQP